MALDVASKGDALTGIKRADTASVEKLFGVRQFAARWQKDIRRTARTARLAGETATRLNKFPRSQWRAGARSSLVARPGWVELWGRKCQQC